VDVDLESLQIQSAGRREVVRVIVDRDGGIDLDLIADLSRRIAALLDAEPLAGQFAGTYVLEVSSPGTDRPLTEEKHWRRAKGRLVEATKLDDSTIAGRIVDAQGGVVEISTEDGQIRAIPLSELRRGIVQLEFTKSGAVAAEVALDDEPAEDELADGELDDDELADDEFADDELAAGIAVADDADEK
ncbi:MAG: ribosome maturation factor RimP, partial [Actinobacteria bacterium]|nr:ribosome maturation factor RimP [Actinomycetota bacterium]